MQCGDSGPVSILHIVQLLQTDSLSYELVCMQECVIIFYYIAKMEVTYMNAYAVVHPYKRPN